MSTDAPQERRFHPGLGRRIGAPIARRLMPLALRRQQLARASQFAALATAPGAVVMFGDSITEFGLWDEWLAPHRVVNRGIGGQTSADLLDRLDTAVNEPRAVFILVGTNDLALGVPLATIVSNVGRLIDGVEDRAPGVPIFLQSVMPRTARFRDDLRRLNEEYRALAASRDGVSYVDLWPVLADPDGALPGILSLDHLHLNGAGYAAWVAVVRPLLEQL